MAKALSSLSVGDKLKFGTYKVENSSSAAIIWKIIDKNHTGYPSNSVTLITERMIDFRGFDAKEPNNANADRQSYGNNRYRTSNIRQWLNSTGSASSWWSAQNLTDGTTNTNNKDATPADAGFSQNTGYDDIQGFLKNFTADEQSKIKETTLRVAKNTITDGGSYEDVTDKIFLLSNTEVGLANENSIAEGSAFSGFNSNANRIAYATAQAIDNTASSSKPANTSTGWYWWLRTPNSGSSRTARLVHSDGTLDYDHAYVGYFGVRPALNLDSALSVSDTTDGDGCYTAVWNATPTISGSDSDLGNKLESWDIKYTVNDTDESQTLTVVEKIDGTTTKTISNATRNQEYTFDLSTFGDLTLAQHTLTITVTDELSAAATRTYTFTKTDDRVEFYLKTAVETSIAAKKIVISGITTVPTGATLTVYACNNGNDATPTWEDVTTAYTNKTAHTFTNSTKTANKWGISVKFKIMKNTATSEINVKAFGFAFE